MDQPQFTSKQQQLQEQREAAARLTKSRKALYRRVQHDNPDLFEDLLTFIDKTYTSYLNSAQKASGIINNEPRSLTMEQRTSLLDKADGISIIKAYLDANLSK